LGGKSLEENFGSPKLEMSRWSRQGVVWRSDLGPIYRVRCDEGGPRVKTVMSLGCTQAVESTAYSSW